MDQKLKARVIAEWRGLPDIHARPDRSRSVSKILEKILPSLGLSEQLDENAVLQAWREIAGDFFASHSTPVRLKGGVLYIRVFQSSVRYELDRTWKARFLSKLQDKFGKKIIWDIRF